MTALEKYAWLEAVGIWRETPDAEPREVIVSFGDATLTLRDMDEQPLGHWALAGMQALRREGAAEVYSTTPDGYETLSISDAEMNKAIAAVSRVSPVPMEPQRRRRWGAWIAVAVLLTGVSAAAAFGPDLIRKQAQEMMTPEQAAEFGDRMLLDLMEQTGPLCAAPQGVRALDRFAGLITDDDVTLHVTNLDGAAALRLPGGRVLLDRQVVENAEAPAVLAALVPASGPAVEKLVATAGTWNGLRYIFTGRMSDETLARATQAVAEPPPTRTAAAPVPQFQLNLTNAEWAALKAICVEE